MNLWTMIFLISAIFAIAGVATTYMNLRYGKGAASEGDDPQNLISHLEQRLDAMEKRLANVETITTGPDFHLKKEFENLERD